MRVTVVVAVHILDLLVALPSHWHGYLSIKKGFFHTMIHIMQSYRARHHKIEE